MTTANGRDTTSTFFQGMKVKVINLDRRPDRWTRFSSQAGVTRLAAQFPVERFSAVDGKTINVETDERISMRTKRNIKFRSRRTHEDIDTVGAIGCYLSHVQIWREFVASGAAAVMVLEDDALVPPNFLDQLLSCSASLTQVTDLQKSIWSFSRPHSFFERDQNTYREGVWICNIATPTTGYILFRGAAQALLANCFPIDNHVDLMMYQATQLYMITTIHHPSLLLNQVAVQRGDSNIQENRCTLCDVPTRPEQKGYLVMSPGDQRQVVVGAILFAAAAGSLYFFSR